MWREGGGIEAAVAVCWWTMAMVFVVGEVG